MYKKKSFDKEVGETRTCKICGTEWHTYKPLWRCQPCTNEIEKQRKITVGKEGIKKKEPYPFNNSNGDATRRFFQIQRELKIAWKAGKAAVLAHYDKQFKEIESNGIMEWITDRRSTNDYRRKGLRNRKKHRDTIDNWESNAEA